MKTKTIAINMMELSINQSVLISLSFLIPFLISGPQLLTGSLVNCFLILSSRLISKRNHLVIAILPSLAAVLNGLVFGKFTSFIVFFLPFIWLGNYVFIRSIIYLKYNLSIPLAIFISLMIKTLILYSAALAYFKFNLVPEIFLTAMGVFQLITGMIGGILFIGIQKILNPKHL